MHFSSLGINKSSVSLLRRIKCMLGQVNPRGHVRNPAHVTHQNNEQTLLGTGLGSKFV